MCVCMYTCVCVCVTCVCVLTRMYHNLLWYGKLHWFLCSSRVHVVCMWPLYVCGTLLVIWCTNTSLILVPVSACYMVHQHQPHFGPCFCMVCHQFQCYCCWSVAKWLLNQWMKYHYVSWKVWVCVKLFVWSGGIPASRHVCVCVCVKYNKGVFFTVNP